MTYLINHQNEAISPPERKFTFGKTLAVVALVFYRNSGYMHRLLAKILASAHTRHFAVNDDRLQYCEPTLLCFWNHEHLCA